MIHYLSSIWRRCHIALERTETRHLWPRAWIVSQYDCIWSTDPDIFSEWVSHSFRFSLSFTSTGVRLMVMMKLGPNVSWAHNHVCTTSTVIFWLPPLMWKARKSSRDRVKIWKYLILTDLLTRVGARNAITSKNCEIFSKDHCVEYPRSIQKGGFQHNHSPTELTHVPRHPSFYRSLVIMNGGCGSIDCIVPSIKCRAAELPNQNSWILGCKWCSLSTAYY